MLCSLTEEQMLELMYESLDGWEDEEMEELFSNSGSQYKYWQPNYLVMKSTICDHLQVE